MLYSCEEKGYKSERRGNVEKWCFYPQQWIHGNSCSYNDLFRYPHFHRPYYYYYYNYINIEGVENEISMR